jgi:hydroxyethylthiazole kinase
MTVATLAIPAPTIDAVIAAHAALRAKRPLVQALTNVVSSNFVANVLLSAGASPAMVDNPEEAALFAGIADGVLINLGTPTTAQVESMRLAAAAAQKAGKPWVLDPIAAGGLPWRGQVAAELL